MFDLVLWGFLRASVFYITRIRASSAFPVCQSCDRCSLCLRSSQEPGIIILLCRITDHPGAWNNNSVMQNYRPSWTGRIIESNFWSCAEQLGVHGIVAAKRSCQGFALNFVYGLTQRYQTIFHWQWCSSCIPVPILLFCVFVAVTSVRRCPWLHGWILCAWGSLQMEALPF